MDIIKALKDLIKSVEAAPKASVVLKKIDEEEQRIIGVVLEPDVIDLHGDTYSGEEVKKACDSFNTYCMKANLQHYPVLQKPDTSLADCVFLDTEVDIEKSFILEVDAMIGDQTVKAGSWIQQWKIKEPSLWEAVKSGSFTGFSIGCMSEVETSE
jgi:hypothetical protein